MTIQPSEGVYGNGAGVTTPIAHRLAQAGGVTKTSGIAIRPGLFWGGSATIVSGTANMSYNVAAFTAALTRGGTGGAYTLANDGTVNVATTAAPGSNSRIDTVYVWQRDYAIDGSNSTPVIGVAQGTAAAVPSAPSLAAFPGALELARITVPSGVTATNSGTTITQVAPFTASAGGAVMFRTTTERDAATVPEGTLGWLLDSDTLQIFDGTNWVRVSGGSVDLVPTVAGSGGTRAVDSTGLITFSGAATSLRWNVSASTLNLFSCIEVIIQYDGSTSGQHTTQLVSGATADSTANSYKRLGAVASLGVGSLVNSDAQGASWDDGALGNRARRRQTMRVYNLGQARETTTSVMGSHFDAGQANHISMVGIAFNHTQTSAYDGMVLTFSSMGTISNGTIRIKGIT